MHAYTRTNTYRIFRENSLKEDDLIDFPGKIKKNELTIKEENSAVTTHISVNNSFQQIQNLMHNYLIKKSHLLIKSA